jgi:hypothetical protein
VGDISRIATNNPAVAEYAVRIAPDAFNRVCISQ